MAEEYDPTEDYLYREPGLEYRYDLTWADVIDCAQAGYTVRDTAAVLEIPEGTFRRKLKARPEIKSMFPAVGGESVWVARKGYCGDTVTQNLGDMTCTQCGGTTPRASNRQLYCPDCRRGRERERDRKRSRERLLKRRQRLKSSLIHPWRMR